MYQTLRCDAEKIARGAIAAVSPEAAVRRVLTGKTFPGRLYLVSVGKAGWKMARAAVSCLESVISRLPLRRRSMCFGCPAGEHCMPCRAGN